MSYLAQLIYRSKATPLFRRGGIEDFVRSTSALNARHGLTGVLLFDGEYFLQVIEGELHKLQSLLDVLKADARHTGLVILRLDAIKERAFPSWGMANVCLRHPAPHTKTVDESSGRPAMTIAQDITVRGDERLHLVIEAFLQGHWRDDHTQSSTKRWRVAD